MLYAVYTMLEDGWMSRAKDIVSGVVAGRPGSPAYTVAILPIAPSDLHGLAIVCSTENIVLKCSESGDQIHWQRDVPDYGSPAVPTNRVLHRFGRSEHLRAGDPHRSLSGVVCIPSFAHVAAPKCGYILAEGTKAKAIAKALYLVNFFSSSNAKWLARLRDEMLSDSNIKRFTFVLIAGVVTRWTTSWLSALSVLRAYKNMRRLLRNNMYEAELDTRCRSSSNIHKSLKIVIAIVEDPDFLLSLRGHC